MRTRAKNPRRQLGQYVRMEHEQLRTLRYIWLFWFVPLLVFVLAWVLSWHRFALILSGIGIGSGVIQHLVERDRLRQYRERAAELRQSSGDA